MSDWVRFHRELRFGEKRGIPRALRFVYMELAHEARARKGFFFLPIGMSDLDGVHEALGGNRKEVVDAVRVLTAEPDPMIRFSDIDGKRACVVVNWSKWNPKDPTGDERQNRSRNGRNRDMDRDGHRDGSRDGPRDTTVTRAQLEPLPERNGPFCVTDTSARAGATLISLSSDSSSSPQPSRESGVISTRATDAEPDTTHRRATNATDDGCLGMAVSAWVAGITSVTDKPFAEPRPGSAELDKLIGGMRVHCPELSEREDWARERGAEFARTNRGKLSAHSFVDWLNSPPATPGRPGDDPDFEDPQSAAACERRKRERALELETALKQRLAKTGGGHG